MPTWNKSIQITTSNNDQFAKRTEQKMQQIIVTAVQKKHA